MFSQGHQKLRKLKSIKTNNTKIELSMYDMEYEAINKAGV